MFDWTHAVDTTDPGYYRWTQWIFLRLLKAGLAYRARAPVNWCPRCRTVLADEQAEGGRCERCESEVERRSMTQWFLRITAYAQRLLDNLDRIDWSDNTREAQRRWIGRSDGATITFRIPDRSERVTVYTTRPETLWGATFLALAPDHPLIPRITSSERASGFSGAYAEHPATGARLPIWISDYVSLGHCTGALMGVPAHDARDFDFAQRFGLPTRRVIRSAGGEPAGRAAAPGGLPTRP